MVVPNPRRSGGDTGGPSRSVQLKLKVSPSVPQSISTRPVSVENAPYFLALVASSWSASPMACAEAARKRNLGPWTAIREPMRVGEMRELSVNQVRDLDPVPLAADEQVLIG
jgi:hypothetical protein